MLQHRVYHISKDKSKQSHLSNIKKDECNIVQMTFFIIGISLLVKYILRLWLFCSE